ncbi:MAG: hypothetical protein ACLGH4_08810 [Actinomycetes bacterium]
MAGSSPQARPSRRRQRSVRVTVAVALLSAASAAVVAALPTQSALWLSIASVLALACGWAAARIIYTELLQSRRDNATDRAAQAQAYKSLFSERASEHAEFTTAMTDRIAAREKELAQLQEDLVSTQRRAGEAEARVQREARRANDAAAVVASLKERIEELEIRKAEEADELATWEGFETAVDLMAWEAKINEAALEAQAEAERKHA